MNISHHVPNLISVARIIATPILVYIARTFSLTPTLGSRLDTIADTLLWLDRQRLGTA